jgi:hypothetical protein
MAVIHDLERPSRRRSWRPTDLRSLAAAVAIVAVAALAGCKTPEDKLVDLRRDQRATLDRLYSEYGGIGVERREETGSAGIFGRILGEADRSYFEQQCLAVGRGERPFSLSAKLDELLRREDVQSDCRRSADLQREIDELQRETSE